MADVWEVTCRPRWKRTRWFFVGLVAAGASLVAVRITYWGELLDVWLGFGLLLVSAGIATLRVVTARVSAGAYGLRFQAPLRHRNVPWHDIADLRVYRKYARTSWPHKPRRVSLVLHDGRERLLPLPQGRPSDDPDFDATVEALRALHRRYRTAESSRVPAVSYRTARRGWAGLLVGFPLLLVFAGMAAGSVPETASYEQAWKSATACTAETPAEKRDECLTTIPAVISRTEDNQPRRPSWLYFTDGRPLERLDVSRDAALGFQAGDRVELTFWRGRVMKVAGKSYVWHENVPTAGSTAAFAAAFALAACCPAAHSLLSLLGRRLRDDKDLPPALPFACALAVTALWLLPLCYFHPTTLLSSPLTITWAVAGSLVTLGLFAGAWHTTHVPAPGATGATEKSVVERDEEEFLAARFLEDTDYNPHGFGTHIVLGGGPLAVAPGPGRFAAKPIPVERLTVKSVRRARSTDHVDRSWDIAELDDAGKPVRLTAAPADLARILRELNLAKTAVNTAYPEP
ncbi:PH domain-containing protein [Streptomyces kebangsaanensis]|uniref:PH domain-containing protein n=1 Tax=Streptomyces kebangsaanensis TaxID=864058 RepID=A0ABW6KUZ4_9ACTN